MRARGRSRRVRSNRANPRSTWPGASSKKSSVSRRPQTKFIPLGSVRQAGGKVVHAWAAPGDFDVDRLKSVSFDMEWPPRSGRTQAFPEVDRAEWFDLDTARRKILQAQSTFIDRLEAEESGGSHSV